MLQAAGPILAGWENFYVIVGSSAAALIGLQFVVIALVKDSRMRTSSGTISAFATPTIVHLASVLVTSAIISAPWPRLLAMSIALALCGLTGISYCAGVILHANRQTEYTTLWQDWLWHMVLPGSAYIALTLAAAFLRASTAGALFGVGAAALGLLLIAIHNAWDTVTFIVLGGQDAATPQAVERPASRSSRRHSRKS